MIRENYSFQYIHTSSFLLVPAVKAQNAHRSPVAYNSERLLTFLSSRRTYNPEDPKVVQTENGKSSSDLLEMVISAAIPASALWFPEPYILPVWDTTSSSKPWFIT